MHLQPYNAAFFKAHETYFSVLKENFGETLALDTMRGVMERSLGAAYDAMGFEQGSAKDFARVVGERDASVGLRVEFPVVEEHKIVYQFFTDPFPGLKGKVDSQELGATYMDFKVQHILGSDWNWKMTKHVWQGDDCIEYVIERK